MLAPFLLNLDDKSSSSLSEHEDSEVITMNQEDDSSVFINEELSPLHCSETIPPDEASIEVVEGEKDKLPQEVLLLLGEDGIPKKQNGENLHEDIARRWESFLRKGISADSFDSISNKYALPSNCTALVPPMLNEEISAAMNEAGNKRDKRLVEKQSKLSTALAALGKLMNNLFKNASDENLQNIEILSDASRLLCGVFHLDSETRRALVIPGLNKEMKEFMEKQPITDFLFGDDLQEKVRACKATKKSAMEIKNTFIPNKNKTATSSQSLNSRGPLRQQQQQQRSARPGGQRQTYQQPKRTPSATSNNSSRHPFSSSKHQTQRRRY